MGCDDSKEDLESKMLMLKLKRIAIRQQREKKIARLEKLTGEKIIIEPVPDYLEDNNDNIAMMDNHRIEQKENIFKKNKDFDFDDEK